MIFWSIFPVGFKYDYGMLFLAKNVLENVVYFRTLFLQEFIRKFPLSCGHGVE